MLKVTSGNKIKQIKIQKTSKVRKIMETGVKQIATKKFYIEKVQIEKQK